MVTCCCSEEREATVLCPRDEGGVLLPRTVVLASSGRGARVDEDALSSFGVTRKAVVWLLRGGEVSRGGPSGRSVQTGLRLNLEKPVASFLDESGRLDSVLSFTFGRHKTFIKHDTPLI